MGIIIFRKRHEEKIYQFDILETDVVVGYAIVNVKTKDSHISPKAEYFFYESFLPEIATRLEKEGATQNLSSEEAVKLRRSEAKKAAEKALLHEAEQIDRVFGK